MKYLFDTANLDELRELSEYLPIAGVTSNPTIVKKEGVVPFFAHMREIRSILAGAHSVTVAPNVLREIFAKKVVKDAVQAFADDWSDLYGGKTLAAVDG